MGSDKWKHPLRGTDFLKRIIMGFQFVRIARRRKVKILHVNLLKPNMFIWILWARTYDIKTVAHVRSNYPEWMPGKNLQKLCNAIICVSDHVREMVNKNFRGTNTHTIYDPIDISNYENLCTKEQAKNRLGLNENRRVISSVGLLFPHKGHDTSIVAFSKLATNYPDIDLLIAGGGPEEEYERLKGLTKNLHIEDRVIFTRQQIPVINDVYRASEFVFSLTKIGEAFGRVPLEAGMCERVVLAPNIGASLELIIHKETGLLVSPEDLQDIMMWSTLILNEPELSKCVGLNAKKHIQETFSSKIHTSKVMNLYSNLIN